MKKTVLKWNMLGIQFWIASVEWPGHKHYCGYASLPYDLPEENIDVHGGITWKEKEGDQWVYGFDTAHYPDEFQTWSIEAMQKETESMGLQLLSLVK